MSKIALVILPSWLETVIRQAGLGLERALDLPALSRISSIDDVGFYTSINMHLFNQLPLSLQRTFEQYRFDMGTANARHIKPDSLGVMPSPATIESVQRRVMDRTWGWGGVEFHEPSPKHLLSILPYMHEQDNDRADLSNFLFELFYITDEIYGVRVSLALSSRPYMTQLYECYDRALRFLTTYQRFPEVARTGVFQEYITLSRSQPHPVLVN